MKTVLVLGAGASLANGLHFRAHRQRDTLPPLDTTFFETVDKRNIALGPALRTYLQTVLALDLSTSTLREQPMEQVFADVFYDFIEAQTDTTRLNAYIDLVDLYMRVLYETTTWLGEDGRRGAPIGKLLAAAAKQADDLTVITFNHDLVIENEIFRRKSLARRWCLDQCYGSMSPSMKPIGPVRGNEPKFTIHAKGSCDHTRPITLLKLHGSLNWMVRLNSKRPTANLLSGNTPIHLMVSVRRNIDPSRQFFEGKSKRGRNRWTLWPIVVPPVYAKTALRGAMLEAWADARAAIEEADRLVVFGYSLPGIDIEAEKLFERAVAKNSALSWIDVINPAHASSARFAEVGRKTPLHWYPSVDAMLEADDLS